MCCIARLSCNLQVYHGTISMTLPNCRLFHIICTLWEERERSKRSAPGFELGTSPTQRENHTTRPRRHTSQLAFCCFCQKQSSYRYPAYILPIQMYAYTLLQLILCNPHPNTHPISNYTPPIHTLFIIS